MQSLVGLAQKLQPAQQHTADELEARFYVAEAEKLLAEAKQNEPGQPGTSPLTPGRPASNQPVGARGQAAMGAMGGGAGMGGIGMIGDGDHVLDGGRNSPFKEHAEQVRRVDIARMVGELESEDQSPANKMILKKLAEPISMSFANETPLDDVLRYIKSATTGDKDTGIPVYVDPAGLKEAGVELNSPVTLDLEGVPLRTTLRLVLKQLKLAYCVKDGVLMISSVNGIYNELEELRGERR
jgi:hypothetical protein